MAEERISRISISEIPQPFKPAVFTRRLSPSQWASQPSSLRMRMEASTSRRRGQPRSSTWSAVSSVAARIAVLRPLDRYLAVQTAAALNQKLAHTRFPPLNRMVLRSILWADRALGSCEGNWE